MKIIKGIFWPEILKGERFGHIRDLSGKIWRQNFISRGYLEMIWFTIRLMSMRRVWNFYREMRM